jgi:hypothetical protein
MRQFAKPRYSGEPEPDHDVELRADGQSGLSQQDILANADDLIRKMMTEQRREYNPRSLPDIMPEMPDNITGEERAALTARHAPRRAWGKALDEVPEGYFDLDAGDDSQPRAGLFARLLRRKPGAPNPARKLPIKRWHVVLAVLAGLTVLEPMLIPRALMSMAWLLLGACLLFCPGRVVDFIAWAWIWVMRRNPALANALRESGDAIVLAAIAVLDRLPGNLADRWTARDEDDDLFEEDEDPFGARIQAGVFRG